MNKSLSMLVLCLLPAVAYGAIAHVGSAANHTNSSATTFTINFTPHAVNNAILVAADCGGSPASITFSATGYSFTTVVPFFGRNGTWMSAATAYAPSTSAAAISATCNDNSSNWINIFVAEFSGVDQTNFVDAATSSSAASGTPTVTITPVSNDDAIWVACDDDSNAPGSGYIQSSTDGSGDIAEYKILTGGAGVLQTATTNGSGEYGCVAIAVKPPSATPTTFRIIPPRIQL